jgi:hypothetical protein
MKYWEIIADRLSAAGWSWGCVSTINSNGQTIFVVDAHRDDGKRFVVRADEKLTAFLELESMLMKERPYGFDQFSDDPWRRLPVRRRLPF